MSLTVRGFLKQEGIPFEEVTITVTADDPTFCGVADVALDYTFTVDSGFALRGGLHSFLFCTAVTENELCVAAERDPTRGISSCPPTAASTTYR